MDPVTLAFALTALVASALIGAMIAPKATKPERASLKDFDIPQVDDGTPQTVVFGDVWLPDWTVLWYGNFRTKPIKSDGSKK